MDADDNHDLEQLMFDELGDEAEDQKPERRVAIDESDNEDDWRDDLHLSESSEEEDNNKKDNGKEDQKEEKEPARKERSPAAKHARVLPPARCGGCGLIGHSQGDAMKCPKVNPIRRAEMDGKRAKTYADRAKRGTQPTALPVICSSAKRAARAGGIAAAQASGGQFSAEGAARAAKKRAMEQLVEVTSSSVGAATTKTTRNIRDNSSHQDKAPVGNATERAEQKPARFLCPSLTSFPVPLPLHKSPPATSILKNVKCAALSTLYEPLDVVEEGGISTKSIAIPSAVDVVADQPTPHVRKPCLDRLKISLALLTCMANFLLPLWLLKFGQSYRCFIFSEKCDFDRQLDKSAMKCG
uniref:FK506-binding protein 4-like n=1 Tax=Globodera pallida TaxID=36090 RepID=A0A183BRC1_GLOPA